ncbi:BUD13 homolog [Uranotaenia lowii]|uniref:BUD13 homolog n=1 Tax=Uranotaenia lowii TaxID=190385 RepID=UPI0024791B14|nr:BUD13 homolog [Uranotaenia lowii]XP_055595364.1 BUD13 homolog [Uranotaenia lowii]
MTSKKIDQKEYLKRYLSNEKDKTKKKKKKKDKHGTGKSNVRIIDADDFDPYGGLPQGPDESDVFALEDEAPLVVGVIDERPPELKAQEDFSSNKWRKLAADPDGGGWGAAASSGKSSLVVDRKVDKVSDSTIRKKGNKKSYDSDESPPRKGNTSYKSKDSDRSLSKKQRRHSCSDESPPRRKDKRLDDASSKSRRYSVSDESPPRRKDKRLDDASRKSRRYSDSDESPPRRKDKHSNKSRRDLSPYHKQYDSSKNKSKNRQPSPYRTQHRSDDSDQSPPRRDDRNQKRRDESVGSPSRNEDKHAQTSRSSRRDYDSDHSPPRRNVQQKSSRRRESTPRISSNKDRRKSDSDESPPRKSHKPKDRTEFPIRVKQEPPDSDESSPRRHPNRRDSDQSPPRRQIKREPKSPEPGPSQRMTKTLDGKRAGLQNARDLKTETEKFRQREAEVFDRMSAEVSGRYAKTVVREKSGKRKDVEEELRREFEKRKVDEKKKEKYTRWGKGVKQVEDYKAQLEEAAHEMNKPLARYADDTDLDDYLKNQERIGDPMLDYIRSKKKEKDRKQGKPEKPTYKGSFPDNRFGIRPGYRWDGVDRSNGFEKKWFEMMGKKKAVEEEAYKYSVEDM